MSATDSAARGRALLAARVEAATAAVGAVPEILAPLLARPARLPRCLVTTGIGTSEGHARHLAELAPRLLGQPARFTTTGALAAGPPPGADADWLVVFSQGLSANARFALQHVERWGGVVLVTGLGPEGVGAEGVDPAKLAALVALERRGVVRIELGCGPEYGALLRVIGARVGHAVAWSLLRTLARRRLEALPALAGDALALARAQRAASLEARRVISVDERLAPLFAPERTVVLMSESGQLELCEHLTLKLAEGMLRPQPRAVDVLHFAHGPLQGLARAPLTILYLLPAGADDSAWRARLAQTLDPALHDLRAIRTTLPMPFAVLELEAIFDDWCLRHQIETGHDLVAWPGAEREAALYEAGPPFEALASVDASSPTPMPPPAGAVASRSRLDEAVWPEVEGWLAAGRRTAILALGSIEQHGPHLPLGTDRWIADALAQRLAAQVGDAVAVPAIPFGCASEHLDFAGTLHVEPETLTAVVRDLLDSLRRHGYERAFLFTAHGGNVDALRAATDALVKFAKPLALHVETSLDAGRLQAAAVAAEGLASAAAGPHAGEYETSVVAWLRPGSVRAEALEAGPPIAGHAGQSLFYPSLRPNAPQGVLGDPTRAARGRGEAYLDAWTAALAAAYHRAFGRAAESGGEAEKNRKWAKGIQKA